MDGTYTRDDLSFFVSAANIAGALEALEIIAIISDDELLEFIEHQYEHYRATAALGLHPDWFVQVSTALQKEFAISKEKTEG